MEYAINTKEEALEAFRSWLKSNPALCWYDPDNLSFENVSGEPQTIFSTNEKYYLITLGPTGIRYKVMMRDGTVRKDSI